MADKVATMKGMTPDLAAKMSKLGIDNTEQLLTATETSSGRRDVATKLGLESAQLTEFINRADLARINGIAGVYADLLENAGVDSVKELAHRVPANLHAKLEEVNGQLKLTTRVPTLTQVEAWVTQAKQLDKA